eukprot:4141372-Amphidinium_carterae.1
MGHHPVANTSPKLHSGLIFVLLLEVGGGLIYLAGRRGERKDWAPTCCSCARNLVKTDHSKPFGGASLSSPR